MSINMLVMYEESIIKEQMVGANTLPIWPIWLTIKRDSEWFHFEISLTVKVAFPSFLYFSISFQSVRIPLWRFVKPQVRVAKGSEKEAYSTLSGCCVLIVFLLLAADRLRAGNAIMFNMANTELIMLSVLAHSHGFHWGHHCNLTMCEHSLHRIPTS